MCDAVYSTTLSPGITSNELCSSLTLFEIVLPAGEYKFVTRLMMLVLDVCGCTCLVQWLFLI